MSDLNEIVQVTITAESLGVPTAAFNIPLIPSCSATWAERTRIYESIDDVADDFPTDSPEYLCAQAVFAQDPSPDSIVIGRMAGVPTQTYEISVSSALATAIYAVNVGGTGVTPTTVSYTAAASLTLGARSTNDFTITGHGLTDGAGPFYAANTGGALPTGLSASTYYWIHVIDANTVAFATSKANAIAGTVIAISGDGSGTNTIDRSSSDVIIGELNQGLNAVVGANYAPAVSGSAGSKVLTATASVAGNWFSLEVTNIALLDNRQTHVEPSPAVADDLDDIQLENDSWYGVVSIFNSDAYVKAFSAWTEAQDKIYLADVCWSETATTVITSGDTADALKTLSRKRTAVMFHSGPNYFAAAAWMGATFPIDPGDDDWMFQQLSGVPPMKLTATHRANIRAKHANSVYAYAGQAITFDGTMADGEFIDAVRGVDWLENDQQVRVFNLLLKSRTKKLPFTNAGIALLASEVRSSLKTAFAMGIINSDFTIIVPSIDDVSESDKALRNLPGIEWSATLQGSVHNVKIRGSVSA